MMVGRSKPIATILQFAGRAAVCSPACLLLLTQAAAQQVAYPVALQQEWAQELVSSPSIIFEA